MKHLQNLVGKKVRLFRGGPESRDGILLDKQSDFLTLSTAKEGVVYYNLNHIKSVIKNSKDGNEVGEDSPDNDNHEAFTKATSFHDLLAKLKNVDVRIDRGGPESRTGKLLDVFSDFLVLYTANDGVIYYKIHHIKSISRETEESILEQKEMPKFINANNFDDLLKNLKYSWVKINRGGPEKIEGVLVDSFEDHLVLTVHDEVNRIPTFHIRNINMIENKKDRSVDKHQEEENQKEQKEKNHEDGHKDGDDKKHENDHKDNDGKKHENDYKKDDEKHEDSNENSYEDHDEKHYEDRYGDDYENEYEEAYEEMDSAAPGPVWYNKKFKLG